MAHTYRRKNVDKDYYWIFWDFRRDLHWSTFNPKNHVNLKSKEAQKALAIYHSDAQRTMGESAPRSYCKIRWHRMRQAAKQQLHKFAKDDEFEVQIDPNHHYSAAWDYW